MDRNDLERLRAPREYPTVSVLAPLDRRRPGNAEDPVRLRHLAEQARRRLAAEVGARECAAVVAQLDDGLASIDLRHPADGVAVFATATESHVLFLPFTVPERVVIDDAFDTRDLARGLAANPRFRLLALAQKPARLLESDGRTLKDVTTDGFPMFVEGAHGEPTSSGAYAPNSLGDAQRDQFFRRVDRALGVRVARDPLPIVLGGTDRDVAAFEQVTGHRDLIVGHFPGNHEATPTHELMTLAHPIVDAHLGRRRAAVASELAEAVGAERGVVGIKPVWQRALEGRGRTVLVETDFEYPARIIDGSLEPAGDADAPEVLDDAVSTLIDLVTDAGGDVVFFEPGELGSLGPVAMLLRY